MNRDRKWKENIGRLQAPALASYLKFLKGNFLCAAQFPIETHKIIATSQGEC